MGSTQRRWRDLTTPRRPPAASCSPAVSIPTPCRSRSAFSALPAASRKAAR
jgi:hypothetical protein